jgi:hypothetical protein
MMKLIAAIRNFSKAYKNGKERTCTLTDVGISADRNICGQKYLRIEISADRNICG